MDPEEDLLPEKKKKRGGRKHKISFDQLKPIKITLYGEHYTIPPYEYARICACAIQGTKTDIKEQAMLAQMSDDQRQALGQIQKFAEAYKDNFLNFAPLKFKTKSAALVAPPIAPEQLLSAGAAAGEAWPGEKIPEPKTINVIPGWPLPTPAAYATGTQGHPSETTEITDYAAGVPTPAKVRPEKTVKVKIPIEEYHRICPCAKK